jgi:hypothetical protein
MRCRFHLIHTSIPKTIVLEKTCTSKIASTDPDGHRHHTPYICAAVKNELKLQRSYEDGESLKVSVCSHCNGNREVIEEKVEGDPKDPVNQVPLYNDILTG